MLSGILDFFTGGSSSSSDKKSTFEDHIVPIVHHNRQNLTYTDCNNWINHRVILQLKRFERPQLGTVKYVGCDAKGVLCAGIEFDYDIGGMSGKVSGQKLFKCKPNHGLLVPVEFVKLLSDHENGTNIFPAGGTPNNFGSSSLNRTQSVPNLSRRVDNVPLEDYALATLPGLKVGDNVVWLGGTDPHTGIVRWIGRAGRNNLIPINAWMEMDEMVGFGHSEMDIGIRFNCAPGRGKFLPVAELILLENFVPAEISSPQDDVLPQRVLEFSIPSPVVTTLEPDPVVNQDLIDFTPDDSEPKGEQTMADHIFNKIVNKPELVENNTIPFIPEPLSNESNVDIVREFSPLRFVETSCNEIKIDESQPPEVISNTVEESRTLVPSEVPEPNGLDVNGNKESSESVEASNENTALSLAGPEVDYLPPFIVPPINIVDFFKAGGSKGIQGRRNSCYIDVVLFSLFAFTDTFDPYFLVKSSYHNKGQDSELTRLAKKILSEQIVNPLRQNYYCPATGVNFLRDLMIPISDKMDGGFMDIEEFMLILFDKVFNLKEFITYDNGMKDYLHQVNLGDHNLLPVMTLKQCLELSMSDYRLKLQEIPSPALIIEIPRNTYGIIQSTTIIPNLSLNLDSVMKRDDQQSPNSGRPLSVMNLVAVICINDFHFVTFVKCGTGPLSHWVLFDSNPSEERPKAEIVPNMGEWLESLEHQCLTNPPAIAFDKHKVPPMVQRLLSDIYVCIYCPANSV